MDLFPRNAPTTREAWWKYSWPLLMILTMALASSPETAATEEKNMVSTGSGKPAARSRLSKPLSTDRSELVSFDHSPFPYRGEIPEQGVPFLDVVDGQRRGHTSPRGGLYWEKPTYNDRRTLLYLPRCLDTGRPLLIVVFFHGNQTQLVRDVRDRQQVPRQLAESGLNAALVAPQFAVDALDSSAGRFWQRNAFARFLDEAIDRLTRLHGDPKAKAAFAAAPVVFVAYSGGYLPAAFAADVGGLGNRLRGLILIDAPYGEEDRFANWVTKRNMDSFFFSAYATAARHNNMQLMRLLNERRIGYRSGVPDSLAPGTVAFFDAGDEIVHSDFVTQAWVDDPLKNLLTRISGFSRSSEKLPAAKR